MSQRQWNPWNRVKPPERHSSQPVEFSEPSETSLCYRYAKRCESCRGTLPVNLMGFNWDIIHDASCRTVIGTGQRPMYYFSWEPPCKPRVLDLFVSLKECYRCIREEYEFQNRDTWGFSRGIGMSWEKHAEEEMRREEMEMEENAAKKAKEIWKNSGPSKLETSLERENLDDRGPETEEEVVYRKSDTIHADEELVPPNCEKSRKLESKAETEEKSVNPPGNETDSNKEPVPPNYEETSKSESSSKTEEESVYPRSDETDGDETPVPLDYEETQKSKTNAQNKEESVSLRSDETDLDKYYVPPNWTEVLNLESDAETEEESVYPRSGETDSDRSPVPPKCKKTRKPKKKRGRRRNKNAETEEKATKKDWILTKKDPIPAKKNFIRTRKGPTPTKSNDQTSIRDHASIDAQKAAASSSTSKDPTIIKNSPEVNEQKAAASSPKSNDQTSIENTPDVNEQKIPTGKLKGKKRWKKLEWQ